MYAGASSTLKGIFAMLAGTAFLMVSDALSKHLAQSHAIGQVICLRQLASMLFIVPFAWKVAGLAALRPRNIGLQILRGLVFVGSSGFIVWSLSVLPLATVTAITFAGPIFIALMSVPLLGERVSARLWCAILLGFAGVLVIIRPGTAAFDWTLLLPLGAALAAALRDTLARLLSRTDTSVSILFWSSLILLAVTALSAPFGWSTVDGTAAVLFLAAGAVNFAAHFLMIEAFRLARAALVAPFKYSALLWSALIGYLIWGDVPGGSLWLGAAILVASGLWIMRMNRGG